MIDAIFFDIDKTLLSDKDGSLPESTRKALKMLQKKNIKIFVASGRHITEIEDQPIKDIPFDGYVCLNGQLILNKQKEIIHAYPLNKEDTKNIVRIFKQRTIPIVLVQEKELYINYTNEYVKKAQDAISSPLPDINPYQENDIYQITAFSNEHQTAIIMNDLPNCKMTRWNPYGVDIISNKGGKSAGIKDILSYYKIKQDQIMAFGDGENDIDMLKFAKISVAMGDADPSVKKVADHITDTAENNGIFNALKYFGIL